MTEDPLTAESYAKLERPVDMSPGCLWHCPASVPELIAWLGIGLVLLFAAIFFLGTAKRWMRIVGWVAVSISVFWNAVIVRAIVINGLTFEPGSFDSWGIGAEMPIALAWALVVVLLLRSALYRWRSAERRAV